MFTLVDNNDSFTFNLYQYFMKCNVDLQVVNINDLNKIDISQSNGIIISPGPGNPTEMHSLIEFIRISGKTVPVLGVCLGFQAIGLAYGGTIIEGIEPVHGKVSEIVHDREYLFNKIPSPMNVTRYHSLILQEESVPKPLKITARSDDGVIMGIRHLIYPIFGVQFHPEAYLTPFGINIIQNYINICSMYKTNIVKGV
ncbi:anthranilate synthase component II [Paenibacillus sp. S33]